ncbi:MAG: hypothetical protein ACR2NP_10775 [Pirellulaceae bacterium]
MSNFKTILCTTALCCIATTALAQSSALDAIPINAQAAMAVKQLDQLEPQLRDLVREIYPGLEGFVPYVLQYYYEWAGFDTSPESDIGRLVDRTRAGGIFEMPVEIREGVRDYPTVSVYPVRDTEALATELGISEDKLLSGSVVEGDADFAPMRYGNGLLYASESPRALLNLDLDGSLTSRLGMQYQDEFADQDAVLFLNLRDSGGSISSTIQDVTGLVPMVESLSREESSTELTRDLAAAIEELDFGVAGVQLTDGIRISYTTFFRDEVTDSQALQFIESIRGGDGVCDVQHLPDEGFLAAFAARGDGRRNVDAAKVVLNLILERISPDQEILGYEDKALFYEMFGQIWQQLSATRVGLYRCADDTNGKLSAVTIFSVRDPQAFMSQLPGLVEFADAAARRYAEEHELPPIGFRFQPAAELIDNLPVDVLEIDTDRLTQKYRDYLRSMLGENASTIRFVVLAEHVVMAIGSDDAALKSAIENLNTGATGLAGHPAIVASNEKLDPSRKIELHLCPENLIRVFDLGRGDLDYTDTEQLVSFSATIEIQRLGFDLWLPSPQLKALITWLIDYNSRGGDF